MSNAEKNLELNSKPDSLTPKPETRNPKQEGFQPLIIGFLCNWCSYAGADLAGVSRLQYPPNVRVVRVMCSARVSPIYILKALTGGLDGVLVGGCHPGERHYMKGNYYARRRMLLAKQLLEHVGIEPERLHLEWISASEGPKFAETIQNFTEEIKKLGPNPLRK